jgi:hypothetical protein
MPSGSVRKSELMRQEIHLDYLGTLADANRAHIRATLRENYLGCWWRCCQTWAEQDNPHRRGGERWGRCRAAVKGEILRRFSMLA